MPTKFVLSLQLDEGPDFEKVKHIPSVTFWYRTYGLYYKSYKLGDSELLKASAKLIQGGPKCPHHFQITSTTPPTYTLLDYYIYH